MFAPEGNETVRFARDSIARPHSPARDATRAREGDSRPERVETSIPRREVATR